MGPNRHPSIRLLFAALLALSLATPARAQGAEPAPIPMTLDALASVATNMGYDVARGAENATVFSITTHGQYDLVVQFLPDAANGTLTLYVFLQKFTEAETQKLDMLGLLRANDSGTVYFSLSHPQDGYSLYLQRILPARAVTPALIRTTIESLQSQTYKMEPTWNKQKWVTK